MKAECKRAQGRAYCYQETPEHLGICWSDCPIELAEAEGVAKALMKKAEYWFNRAADLADA